MFPLLMTGSVEPGLLLPHDSDKAVRSSASPWAEPWSNQTCGSTALQPGQQHRLTSGQSADVWLGKGLTPGVRGAVWAGSTVMLGCCGAQLRGTEGFRERLQRAGRGRRRAVVSRSFGFLVMSRQGHSSSFPRKRKTETSSVFVC